MNEWGGGSNNNDIKIICLLYFILFLEKKILDLGGGTLKWTINYKVWLIFGNLFFKKKIEQNDVTIFIRWRWFGFYSFMPLCFLMKFSLFLVLFPAQRFGTLKRLVFITKEGREKKRFDDWNLESAGDCRQCFSFKKKKNRNYNFELETLFGRKNNFNIMQVDLNLNTIQKKGRRCIVT